jgi:hypothetical protein
MCQRCDKAAACNSDLKILYTCPSNWVTVLVPDGTRTTYPSQRRDQGEVFKDFATLTLTHTVIQIKHDLCKGYLCRRNVGVGVDRAEANEIKKASESIHVIGEDQGARN